MDSTKPKNTAQMFLILMALFLVCSSPVFAENQIQKQKGIISMIENEPHGEDIFGSARNYFNTLWFYGEVLISRASSLINPYNSTHAEEENSTTQADLDFWYNLQAQYPFSEKPVFISINSICGLACDYVPEGVSEVTITDNSGNALDFYTVTKKENGFTIQKGIPDVPDHIYTITLNELEELDETYGDIGLVKTCERYLKDQIQKQAET
jgi:hypothetical protein